MSKVAISAVTKLSGEYLDLIYTNVILQFNNLLYILKTAKGFIHFNQSPPVKVWPTASYRHCRGLSRELMVMELLIYILFIFVMFAIWGQTYWIGEITATIELFSLDQRDTRRRLDLDLFLYWFNAPFNTFQVIAGRWLLIGRNIIIRARAR